MDHNILIIGNQVTVFAGSLPDIGIHAHSTAVLVFSLTGGKISVRQGEDGRWQDHHSYFLNPEVTNEIRQYGHSIGAVFFEPDSAIYPLFVDQNDYSEEGIHSYTKSLDELISLISDFKEGSKSVNTVLTSIVKNLVNGNLDTGAVIDHRITECSQQIKQSLSENLNANDLAASVSMTERQLSKLFKKHTGLPLRKYRIWFRLKEVARLTSQGKQLTEAALDAGFSDSAHFSNTCRKLLGIKPSDLLVTNTPLVLYAGSNEI